jgi:hypothetical protein
MGSTMSSFNDWLNKSLTISAHPAKKPLSDDWWKDYDIVINVSDYIDHTLHHKFAAHGVPAYWLPLGETYGFPLENIFGTMSVLWYAEHDDKSVFMHCTAGRNRSVCIADCYYYLRTGEHRPDNSEAVVYGRNKGNKLILNVNDNQLPGIYRMENFLENCKKLFENPNIADEAYVDWLKKETFGY